MSEEEAGAGTQPEAKAMWGGRFSESLRPEIHAFTNSLPFDRRMAPFDLLGSRAHARMLTETGIIPAAEGEAILRGLEGMSADLATGAIVVEGPDEDVHSWIERTLRERIGSAAGWLHTARSRNDQTALALRLLVRHESLAILDRLLTFQDRLVSVAGHHVETWIPAYTHLQRAQPVSLAHHLLAHATSLEQDVTRWIRVHDIAGASPLGAGAAAGTSFPIRPERVAELLGLESAFTNSMHAVADRDYVIEAVFAAAMTGLHLSRWADEVVLWSTREFGFIELADSVAQGSSLMPQKKNPEAAEILRGKSARLIGDLTTLLSLVRGLPLTYNSDLQEDKEPLFDAIDTTRGCLEVAVAIAGGLQYRADRMGAALMGGMMTATELADELVRRGVSFRDAHEQAGQAVRLAESRGVELHELAPEELFSCAPSLRAGNTELQAFLHPHQAAGRHTAPGGPAPERVREQLTGVRERLARSRDRLTSAQRSWAEREPLL